MANKDKYKSILERYRQALIKNPKLNLSAYCRLNGVSVSGMHHYIEDIGQSVKSIRDPSTIRIRTPRVTKDSNLAISEGLKPFNPTTLFD